MNRFRITLLLLLAMENIDAAETPIDFSRDIRPILSNQCFSCHGPDEEHREGDLRLDEEADAKKDRGGYFVVKPQDPNSSEFILRIRSEDEDTVMPPVDSGKKLTPEQVELLSRWIQQGAPWESHWAFVAPKKHPIPDAVLPDWATHWIDRFIVARIQRENLSPSRQADRVTLIRRLTFDLTGLPPTPDEVHRFLHDRSEMAYQRVVDRLLASSAYGERMAIYWLDLVRYADTVGYHGDQDHNISPYRDYVIDSFNDNKPFDDFTKEQLAGDLLPNPTIEQKIATGYNRLLQTSHEGGVQPKEYLAIYAADRVRNVSAVWMGGTLGCAQCHDHKYDPYTTRDFYSMVAFFADIDEAQHFKRGTNDLPTARPPEISVADRVTRRRIEQLQEQAKRHPQTAKPFFDEINRLEKSNRKSMITVALAEPRTIRVLPRGNWLDDSGLIVSPAVPAFMDKSHSEESGRQLTRLDLAHWLTNEGEAGLFTARVFVNRLWCLFMGQGLCSSLDDFGGQGQLPEHPELLDNLAWEFVNSGWDVKQIVRLIVSSQTYRQSSLMSDALTERDPNNQLFARQSRFRLSSEMIRDNALAISGLLVQQLGGPSVRPYQPAGYYRHLNFPHRKYKADADYRQYRRGVYVHWQRQFLHPMMKAFDAPSREECTARRPQSNTPLAALALLNDPTFLEAARVFAGRILLSNRTDDASRIELAFELAASRAPDPTEKKILLNLLADELNSYRENRQEAQQLLSVGHAATPTNVDSIELAAWTTVARAILNLSEVIIRN